MFPAVYIKPSPCWLGIYLSVNLKSLANVPVALGCDLHYGLPQVAVADRV